MEEYIVEMISRPVNLNFPGHLAYAYPHRAS
jgi:hypothetical protein